MSEESPGGAEAKTQSRSPQPERGPAILKPSKRSLWSNLWSSFVAGVVVVAPVGITIALIYWFVTGPMAKVDIFVRRSLPGSDMGVPPGLGVLLAFLGILALGAFAKNFVGRAFIKAGQELLEAVPVVRQLYKFFKNVFETALQQSERSFKEVALVEYPRAGAWAIAFVVGDAKGEVVKQLASEMSDAVSVFIPTVPNPTSGFLLFVPRSRMRSLAMTVEDAAKMVFSLGLVVPEYLDPDDAVRRLEAAAGAAQRDQRPAFQLHFPGRGKTNRNGSA
jgi:uncharacterized membrane protein